MVYPAASDPQRGLAEQTWLGGSARSNGFDRSLQNAGGTLARPLIEQLGDELLLFVAEEEGRIIGGATFTVAPQAGIMQYHLSAAEDKFRHRQPAKLIIHTAREWGRQNGYKCLHLGGGLGSQQDPLFEFKAGFSPDTHVFRTQRVVVDPQRYVALAGNTASVLDDLSGFFPAYRSDAQRPTRPPAHQPDTKARL